MLKLSVLSILAIASGAVHAGTLQITYSTAGFTSGLFTAAGVTNQTVTLNDTSSTQIALDTFSAPPANGPISANQDVTIAGFAVTHTIAEAGTYNSFLFPCGVACFSFIETTTVNAASPLSFDLGPSGIVTITPESATSSGGTVTRFGTATYQAASLATPEPGAAVPLALAAAAFVLRRRRRAATVTDRA